MVSHFLKMVPNSLSLILQKLAMWITSGLVITLVFHFVSAREEEKQCKEIIGEREGREREVGRVGGREGEKGRERGEGGRGRVRERERERERERFTE